MPGVQQELKIQTVRVSELNPAAYNPRKWSDEAIAGLKESIRRYGLVDPVLVNSADNRKNIVIGGHFRLKVAKDLGITEVPVVYLDIPDEAKERELNLRLNKNQGEWDFELLAEFDETLLADIGFNSEELDEIFNDITDEPDDFNLQKELEKLNIKEITVKEGDVYQLGDSKLMCGDSTNAKDFAKLMGDEKADMCMTDPPYILDYLHGKRKGGADKGFGAKQNRVYIGTESLPDNFTELWMANVAKHSDEDFSIIVYENWKNLQIIWSGIEQQGWKVKNMIVWHLPNRHQGFAAKYKFFSKHDIAMVGGKGNVEYNHDEEEGPLQEMYETALYAIQGKPHWEGYEHGKNALLQPTDFIEYNADDEKQSGQNVIFGTKPLNILIPYIKFLTKRGDLVVEPFCGSGSTLIASVKLGRRCYIMEKQPIYAEVALARWEKETGLKRQLISGANQDA